ncbi:MAG: gliding motility protein GldC [Flavobacteriales bacterium]
MEKNQSELKFKVTLDENKVPEKIEWEASDMDEQSACKAVMVSLWDANEKNTLRIDLWTKDMYVEEMKMFFHQSILTMSDAFERSTGETQLASEMREFGRHLAEKMGLIKTEG